MTTPTQEQRDAARDLYAALPPDHAVGGDPIGPIAEMLATREAPLRLALGEMLGQVAERERERDEARRDYRIVEAAIRSLGFPVVEAEAAAAAVRKLGQERDELRTEVEALRALVPSYALAAIVTPTPPKKTR